jgi:sigma-54 specific flagellar transcriptional regulator A
MLGAAPMEPMAPAPEAEPFAPPPCEEPTALTVAEPPPPPPLATPPPPFAESLPAPKPGLPIDLPSLLKQLEDSYIDAALQLANGNRKSAADLLGLQRTTLVEKLRRRSREAAAIATTVAA